MRIIRKMILSLLIILIFTSICNAEVLYQDVYNSRYRIAIEVLSEKGIVGGYPGGNFFPEKGVTRAEYCAIITRLLGISESELSTYSYSNFNDMKGYGWAIPYVSYCQANGIIAGDGRGNVLPGNQILNSEAAAMLIRALKLESQLDDSLVWPNNYLELANLVNLFNEMPKGIFQMNRGDSCMMIYNSLQYIPSKISNISLTNISLYRNFENKLIQSDAIARNLDKTIYISFALDYSEIEKEGTITLEIQTRPLVEKKIIRSEYRTFKLNKGSSSLLNTAITIEDLVKDNLDVNEYQIVIKNGNKVLGQRNFKLFIDYSKEIDFINTVKVDEIRFYSSEDNKWVPEADREYASVFKWSPTFSTIGSEMELSFMPCPDFMEIPITIKLQGPAIGEYTPTYYFYKGSTKNNIHGYMSFNQFAAKKFQPGTYTITYSAFDKTIGTGRFKIE